MTSLQVLIKCLNQALWLKISHFSASFPLSQLQDHAIYDYSFHCRLFVVLYIHFKVVVSHHKKQLVMFCQTRYTATRFDY